MKTSLQPENKTKKFWYDGRDAVGVGEDLVIGVIRDGERDWS